MRQTISGPFIARSLGPGTWQLTALIPSGPEIYLQGTGLDARELLQDANIAGLSVEWRGDAVVVTVNGPSGVAMLTGANAIIHEPQATLYESLPLATFDSDAKRFWHRVFRLMRFPGGRFLLKLMTRRRRDS